MGIPEPCCLVALACREVKTYTVFISQRIQRPNPLHGTVDTGIRNPRIPQTPRNCDFTGNVEIFSPTVYEDDKKILKFYIS
jgi:hypothetical protein